MNKQGNRKIEKNIKWLQSTEYSCESLFSLPLYEKIKMKLFPGQYFPWSPASGRPGQKWKLLDFHAWEWSESCRKQKLTSRGLVAASGTSGEARACGNWASIVLFHGWSRAILFHSGFSLSCSVRVDGSLFWLCARFDLWHFSPGKGGMQVFIAQKTSLTPLLTGGHSDACWK